MSIQKKSLISTLKTTKKANVATTISGEGFAKAESVNPKRAGFTNPKRAGLTNPKRAGLTNPKRAGLTNPKRAKF